MPALTTGEHAPDHSADHSPDHSAEVDVTAVAAALTALAVDLVHRLPRRLSYTALGTLADLRRCGPLRLTTLARHQGVAQPTMTSLVSRLEEEGLAQRRSDPHDGRVVLVAITESGEHLLDARREAGGRLLSGWISTLGAPQKKALLAGVPALLALVAAEQAATADPSSKELT